jgi:hypothetical protein
MHRMARVLAAALAGTTLIVLAAAAVYADVPAPASPAPG